MADTGRVKWFSNDRGFGFIEPDNGERELFAHHQNIIMEGYKTLKCFQRVTYDVEHGKNGRHAVNIIPGEAPKPQKSSDIPKEHISKTDI
ncbi:Cold shock protein [gamma proteobacterium HTCC2207]|jgi:CspA family cold shock protein|uniref:Cold shock protein n=1 Tax=gamma proteobacterium HTCC2207 TaxID=314287 RepID=Q1YTJ3_9GAMM|nr:Cold shock protein [gamma proteobacterium HTCC2207]MBT5105281.1 cold shock domain-containing protein [Porticoccaceae bacterium]MDG1080002.1 cold shock domain-containing protein [Porticoccaceae bacterium]